MRDENISADLTREVKRFNFSDLKGQTVNLTVGPPGHLRGHPSRRGGQRGIPPFLFPGEEFLKHRNGTARGASTGWSPVKRRTMASRGRGSHPPALPRHPGRQHHCRPRGSLHAPGGPGRAPFHHQQRSLACHSLCPAALQFSDVLHHVLPDKIYRLRHQAPEVQDISRDPSSVRRGCLFSQQRHHVRRLDHAALRHSRVCFREDQASRGPFPHRLLSSAMTWKNISWTPSREREDLFPCFSAVPWGG